MSKVEQYCHKCKSLELFMFSSEIKGWLCLVCGTKYDGRKARYKEKELFKQGKLDYLDKEINRLKQLKIDIKNE